MLEQVLAKLQQQRDQIQQQWANPQGTKTRYFVVDDLLPREVAEAIYAAFPHDGGAFECRDSFRERKRTYKNLTSLPEILTEATYVFQHPEVIRLVEELTGLSALEGDPLLYAGGLSMMFQDDFLNPHIDNSHDSTRARYRRFNLLYYVSPDWQSEHGGNLELWDDHVRQPVEIVSQFNRLVVMETNDQSWHSVNPVKHNQPRCCVSNYYFSEASPKAGQDYYHVTSFLGRPNQPWRRAYGRVDNLARQMVATLLGISRGKQEINQSVNADG